MRFAVSVSRERRSKEAGGAVARSVKANLKGKAHLACLFLSAEHAERAEELSAVVREELGDPVLVGCTGEGVIAGMEEIEDQPAVALWAATLPSTHLVPIRPAVLQRETDLSVEGWPEQLDTAPERPVFLMLADPFSSPVEEVLASLAKRYPGSAAIGGMAGGGRDVGETRLLLNGCVYDHGVVAVAISGGVSVRTIVSQGCRPIGERLMVTKAENNVIYELSGVPALEQLEALFNSLSPEEQRMAQRALHIGIVIDEHRTSFDRGDFLIRNLIGADRSSGSLAIGDMVKEGQTVQFQVRDARSASEDLHLLLAQDRTKHKNRPLGALLFSCCGRGRGMFGRPHHDVMAVLDLAGAIPVAGFFAQGEIGPVGGRNLLHGYTASLALFAEPAS